MPAFAGMTMRCRGDLAYLNAEKRLSNEFAGTIGGGCAAACLVSAAFGAAATALGADASGRGGSFRLASMTFGFAGIGCALAVVSAEPPRPTLRARLLNNPSAGAIGAADATRVAGACAGAIEATNGSCGAVTGPRGGLTVAGMVPGARVNAASDRP